MATAFKDIRISPEQYLDAEKGSEVRHEFANGFVVAQAGASRIHNLIAVAASSILRTHLKGNGIRLRNIAIRLRIYYKSSTQIEFRIILVLVYLYFAFYPLTYRLHRFSFIRTVRSYFLSVASDRIHDIIHNIFNALSGNKHKIF